MTPIRKILPSYTYADYLCWEGRWELIDGIAYDMNPMPSPRHQRISLKLGQLIQNELDKISCNCVTYDPIDLKIDEQTVVNPDLLIICEDVTGQYYDKPPKLVVEILSPSSKLYDTVTKYDLYKGFGVTYYLIVDPMLEAVTLHELADGLYQATTGTVFTLSL